MVSDMYSYRLYFIKINSPVIDLEKDFELNVDCAFLERERGGLKGQMVVFIGCLFAQEWATRWMEQVFVYVVGLYQNNHVLISYPFNS